MNAHNVTSLAFELARMEAAKAAKLERFKPPREPLTAALVSIIVASSRSRITPDEVSRIEAVVQRAVVDDAPVVFSFLWAAFCMAQSPWKSLQPKNWHPRLGDYWAFHWLDLLSQKVQKIFAPGCRFVIVEETALVECFGWTEEASRIREAHLAPVYNQLECVRMVRMPRFEELPEVEAPSDGEVIATLMASDGLLSRLPPATRMALIDACYTRTRRDLVAIRGLIPPELWDEAALIKTRMMRMGAARKSTGWLDEEVMGGTPYIDGAIVNKGRWSPNFTKWATPQHGGSVLSASELHAYRIEIAPEYRLVETHTPVCLTGEDPAPGLILYWEKGFRK